MRNQRLNARIRTLRQRGDKIDKRCVGTEQRNGREWKRQGAQHRKEKKGNKCRGGSHAYLSDGRQGG